MNLEYVRTLWEELRMVNGITLRVIELVPADKVTTRPIREMRTPAELVVHMAETLRHVAEGAASGTIRDFEPEEKTLAAKIQSREELLKLMSDSWAVADRAIAGLKPEQATGLVKSPWGMDFPGWMCAQIIFDEQLHHRGQLCAFLRALGTAPPNIWDFENNAAEFRPRQHQKA